MTSLKLRIAKSDLFVTLRLFLTYFFIYQSSKTLRKMREKFSQACCSLEVWPFHTRAPFNGQITYLPHVKILSQGLSRSTLLKR